MATQRKRKNKIMNSKMNRLKRIKKNGIWRGKTKKMKKLNKKKKMH